MRDYQNDDEFSLPKTAKNGQNSRKSLPDNDDQFSVPKNRAK
jgi:hypothetical protein